MAHKTSAESESCLSSQNTCTGPTYKLHALLGALVSGDVSKHAEDLFKAAPASILVLFTYCDRWCCSARRRWQVMRHKHVFKSLGKNLIHINIKNSGRGLHQFVSRGTDSSHHCYFSFTYCCICHYSIKQLCDLQQLCVSNCCFIFISTKTTFHLCLPIFILQVITRCVHALKTQISAQFQLWFKQIHELSVSIHLFCFVVSPQQANNLIKWMFVNTRG